MRGVSRRHLLGSVAACALTAGPARSAFWQGSVSRSGGIPAGWSEMLVGPGGFIQHAQFANDGTCVIVTDTGGAYIGNATPGHSWVYTPTAASLPSSPFVVYDSPVSSGHGIPNSVYAFAVAPSNSQNLVMVLAGYTMISSNQGSSYTQVSTGSVPQDTTAYSNQNGNYGSGPLAAFDPQNASVIVAGLPQQGVYYSLDGGSTWAKVSGIAASTLTGANLGRYCICFDPSSAVTGGKTQGVFIGVYGTGVYHSTTGLGGTFSLMSGSPASMFQLACASDGYLSVITGADRTIWMWNGSSGATLTPANPNGEGNPISCCAWDPGTVGRLIANAASGTLNVSLNHGTTFTGWSVAGSLRFTTGDGITWLATANGASYMSLAAIAFDPSQSNVLLGTAGVGVYITSPLNNYSASNITWQSSSLNIEQLVTNKITSNTNGDIYTATWDRPFFNINNTTYPSDYQPSSAHGSVPAGWDIDYAGASTSKVVGAAQGAFSGYSTDRLVSWNQFASNPNNTSSNGGMIAVDASGASIVYVSADSTSSAGQSGAAVVGVVKFSSNNGASWASATMTPTQPTVTPSGWGYNGFTPHTLCSDKVTANTFYALSSVNGVYRSTDGGANWTQRNSSTFATYNLARGFLRANPLVAGDLWAGTGTQFSSHPANVPFLHSTDGGATWTNPNANVKEVLAFGFGAVKPGQSYATIWIAGWVSGVFGIWRSIDTGVSYTQMNDPATGGIWPSGVLDLIYDIEGDMTNYALVYIGFNGSGFRRGNFV